MKRFSFSLDRVLGWRIIQRDQELSKLERLAAVRGGLMQKIQAIQEQRDSITRELLKAPMLDGQTLAIIPEWQMRSRAEVEALEVRKKNCDAQIAMQQEAVRNKEREVELLERLREKRHRLWVKQGDLEDESLAAEAYLARCIRLKRKTAGTGA